MVQYIIILRGHRLKFPKNIVFLSLKIDFGLANSADPDEMLHHAAFQLGLQCLPKYPLGVLSTLRVPVEKVRQIPFFQAFRSSKCNQAESKSLQS